MKRAGYAALLLGVTLLVLLMLGANWDQVMHALKALGLGGLLVVALLHLPVIAISGLAWWYIGRSIRGTTLAQCIRARLVRDSVAQALPLSQVGGFVAGARTLSLAGIPVVHSGLSMLADLIVEFASLLPYVVLGVVALLAIAPASGLLHPLALGIVAFAGLVFLAWAGRRQIANGIDAAGKIVIRRWAKAEPDANIHPIFSKIFSSPRSLIASFLLHFGCWAFGAVEIWAAVALMGVPITLGEALIIDSLASALRIFSFMVPAALGIQEGCFVFACGILGLPPSVGLALSFVWRARGMLIGLPGLAVWQSLEASAQAKRSRPTRQTEGSDLREMVSLGPDRETS